MKIPMKIAVEIHACARLASMPEVTSAPVRLVARESGSGLTTPEEMNAAALLLNHPHADAIATALSGQTFPHQLA